MSQQIELTTTLEPSHYGQRLDQALAERFSDYSRTRIKEWIVGNGVTVNGQIVNRPKERMFGDEHIVITAVIEEDNRFIPQDIALNIIYEDEHILVINKPCGLVVHPGAGNPDGTVLNALLYHYSHIDEVPRAGIVHRLDKDTTGLMVIAKTIPVQTRLVDQLQQRQITREYEAVVMGLITAGGSIDEPIARHAVKRTHMAVYPLGKPAVTHYRVVERFRMHTHLRLRLETGRTHQIRVHMAHIHHPLIGDPLYGVRVKPPKGADENVVKQLQLFNRQALHAVRLILSHPVTGETMEWQAPIPDDMQQLIAALQADKQKFAEQLDW